MKLKFREKASYAVGALGKDLVYMFVASYLLIYYNTVLGMDSVFIGAIMMAARIFDAFNDPIMGVIVAKTKTKFGKYRPWIFVGTVLNALTIYALYATPKGDPNSALLKTWLTVFYFAWGITYTLMDIPFWSMIPAITESGSDRDSISSTARTFAGIGDGFVYVLTPVIVPLLAGIDQATGEKFGYKIWALIIAVVFVISEVICVINVKERVVEKEEKPEKLGTMIKALFKNDQALAVIGSIILVYTSLNICGNLIQYFFKYDVCNYSLFSVFTAVCFAAQVLAMFVSQFFMKKISKNKLFIFGFIAQIVGFAIIIIMSYTGLYSSERWYVLLIPGVLIYVGYGLLNVILTVFLSDTVDYGEVKNKTRDTSVLFSMQTFSVKLASGIAVFIAGLVIKWVHIDINATAQTAGTLTGLRLWMTIPSIVLLLVGLILYKACYKLSDAKMDEIKAELNEKRQKEAAIEMNK